MVKILLSTIVLSLIAYVDGKQVVKSKDLKKIVTYSSIYFTASILIILLFVGVKIPNPIEPVQKLIISIFGKD